jgi:hypothetical protein
MVNEMLTYAIMLDSLMAAYVKFVIILIELKELLGQELKCLYSKTTTVLSQGTIPKTMDVSLLHFYCIEIIYCIAMYVTVQKYISSTGLYVD